MKKLVIGITGINAMDNPGPGIGVARSLKEAPDLDVDILGFSYDAMEPGIYMDWLIDQAFVMPYPSCAPSVFINRIRDIHQRFGLNMLISTLDSELPLYMKCQQALDGMGIKTSLPTLSQFQLRSKERLADIAQAIGVNCPRTEIVTSFNELSEAMARIQAPVMIKGALYKAYRANTEAEAQAHFSKIVAEFGYPILVQEIVKGEEMNVVGVGDGEGACLGKVGIKKLVTTSLGKIWNGVTIKNPAMLEATEVFVKHSKWQGGFELESICMGDKIYLIEINPRFPAWTYFATGVGVNLPAQMVRHAYGQPCEQNTDYDAGKLLVRYTYEQITDMTTFQQMSIHGER